MQHVVLICKHHPHLRWSCKEIAYTEGYGYNGCRNIFFLGVPIKSGALKYHYFDGETVHRECSCPATDLIKLNGDYGV